MEGALCICLSPLSPIKEKKSNKIVLYKYRIDTQKLHELRGGYRVWKHPFPCSVASAVGCPCFYFCQTKGGGREREELSPDSLPGVRSGQQEPDNGWSQKPELDLGLLLVAGTQPPEPSLLPPGLTQALRWRHDGGTGVS